jgi:hypothetical protein
VARKIDPAAYQEGLKRIAELFAPPPRILAGRTLFGSECRVLPPMGPSVIASEFSDNAEIRGHDRSTGPAHRKTENMEIVPAAKIMEGGQGPPRIPATHFR